MVVIGSDDVVPRSRAIKDRHVDWCFRNQGHTNLHMIVLTLDLSGSLVSRDVLAGLLLLLLLRLAMSRSLLLLL